MWSPCLALVVVCLFQALVLINGLVLPPSLSLQRKLPRQFTINMKVSPRPAVLSTSASFMNYLTRSKISNRLISKSALIQNQQLITDLVVFIVFELFSHKSCSLLYYLDENIIKKILRQPFSPNKYSQSLWFFIEERGHAIGRLFMWNLFSKLACLFLSKLGFRIQADFPSFMSKLFFILFCFNSVDKLKRKLIAISFAKKTDSRRQVYVFNKFSSFLINTVGVLVACESIASYMKIPLSSLLAFGGVGGLTLGLSVKGLVGNFLGGLLLLGNLSFISLYWLMPGVVNEPFTPGDTVMFRSGPTSRDKDLIGRVEHVSWGQTQIRGNDTRPTYIPNSHFVNTPVTNIERISHRKYETKISLAFEDYAKMGALTSAIKAKLKKIPKLDILSQPFRVSFTEITANR